MHAKLQMIYDGVIEGHQAQVEQGVSAALTERIAPQVILNEAMIAAMREVGARFECGEYYVPEMLIAARAMKAGLAILKPVLAAAAIEPISRIALGTVKGDLHDIGKNLVGMMLEGAGFEVIDLGVDVTPEKFLDAVKSGIPFLGMSALLTTTMPMMKTTIDLLIKHGVRDQVRILVGGAPVTASFAESIGADACATDASAAARQALDLVHK